jgi:hypothetical protein
MINLERRRARMPGSLSGRTEKHGEDDIPACDLTLREIVLTMKEVQHLCGDKLATSRFFDDEKGIKKPAMPYIAEFKLNAKFEGAEIVLILSEQEDGYAMQIEKAKIANLILTPQVGGDTLLQCQLQLSDLADSDFGRLMGRLNKTVWIEITDAAMAVPKAKDKQAQLPLASPTAEDPPTPVLNSKKGKRKGTDELAAH